MNEDSSFSFFYKSYWYFGKILIQKSLPCNEHIMNDDETKACPNCGSTMIKKQDYLPDDFELKEIKIFWLCSGCMSYELVSN